MITSLKRCIVLALMGCGWVHAQGVIYKCMLPNGSIEYTDVNRGSYCKSMDLPGTVVPAPARRQVPVMRPSLPTIAPGDFPRVDGAEQRARDADRRGILEDELKNESQKLAELRKQFNNGEPERRGDERNYAKYQERVAALRDSISRSEKNVDALKREIANIR
jgi:hypothetical protein